MKLKKWIQIVLISSSILTLTACSHRTRPNASDINDANSAYNTGSGAQSSGLGQESTFGDQGMGGSRSLYKRVYYFDYDSNVVHETDKPAIASNANYLTHPGQKSWWKVIPIHAVAGNIILV